jgi:ribulose-bisphosphate carboxylase small chain
VADMEDVRVSRRYETFSYLPPMDAEQVRRQIEYMIAQGWNLGIEHTRPTLSGLLSHFWHMWKLPMFGEDSVEVILTELDSCRRAYPDDHVRLIGYDNYTQSQGLAFVVHRGKEEA